MNYSSPRSSTAFSVTELLWAIVIIAVVAALSMAGLRSVSIASKQAGCVANLRSLNLIAHAYANDHSDCFPRGFDGNAWVSQVKAYLTEMPRFHVREAGVTFCPATKTGGEGIFRRNSTQWLTDYNANRFVFSGVERENKRGNMPGSRIMFFDGQGGLSGSAATSNQRLRHRETFNVVLIDGSVQTLHSFAGFETRWDQL